MTEKEAKYFKDYIDKRLNELFQSMSKDEQNNMFIKSFADRHMLTITGQQMLPQSVFREFLKELDLSSIFNEVTNWLRVEEGDLRYVSRAEVIELINERLGGVDMPIDEPVEDEINELVDSSIVGIFNATDAAAYMGDSFYELLPMVAIESSYSEYMPDVQIMQIVGS